MWRILSPWTKPPHAVQGRVPIALEYSLHEFHLHVMARAQELRNVTLACREIGVACRLFCCWPKH